MAIVSTKLWVVRCDADGCPADHDTEVAADDHLELTGRIWTRGDLQLHLRRLGWTVGKTVLCPNHKGT